MKFPTVSACCCCINLRTAGYIIGFLGLFGAVLTLASGTSYISGVINVALCVFWIFGINKDKSNYLLPTVVIGFIGLIIVYLAPLIIVLLISLFPDVHDVREFKKDYPHIKYYLLATYVISVLLGTYFWIVEYSVYRHVKEAGKGRYSQPRSEV